MAEKKPEAARFAAPSLPIWRVFSHKRATPAGVSAMNKPAETLPAHSLPAEKLVVVVGAEGRGLPEEVIAACSRRVTIPAFAASLNVAVAASILLYEAYMRVLP